MSSADPAGGRRSLKVSRWLDIGLFSVVLVSFVGARLVRLQRLPLLDTTDPVTFGLFPHHLTAGLVAGPAAYLPEPQQGCALIWGLPCAVVFGAAGPTVDSLRLCSLLWQALLLLVFLLLARAASGRRAAALVGLLWVLAPPALAGAALSGLPDHLDGAVLTGAALLLLVTARPRQASRQLFGAGLLVGIAAWFTLDTLLWSLPILVAAWLRLRGAGRRAWVAVGCGLVLGLTPLFALGGFWRSERLADLGPRPEGLLARTVDLFSSQLPWSPGFADPAASVGGLAVSSPALGALYLALLASLGVVATRGEQSGSRLIARVALAGAALHVVGTLLSGLPVNSPYLWPLWPWLVLAAALGLGRLVERTAPGRLLAAAAGVGILTSLFPVGAGPALDPAMPAGAQARTWLGRTAGHNVVTHPLGSEVFTELPAERRRRLVRRQPDRADLLRLHGRGLVREAHAVDLGERGGDPLLAAIGPSLFDAAREYGPRGGFLLLLGAGEEAALLADEHESTVLAPEWIFDRLGPQVASAPDDLRLPLELGIAAGIGSRAFPAWSGDHWAGARGGGSRRADTLLCVALGLWALETSTGVPVPGDVPSLSRCSPAALGVGAGLGLALRLEPSAGPGPDAPRPAWWVGHEGLDPEAFRCAFGSAWSELLVLRRSIAARSAVGPPDFGLACPGGPGLQLPDSGVRHPLCGLLAADARAATVAASSAPERPLDPELLPALLDPGCSAEGQASGARIAAARQDPERVGLMFAALLRSELGALSPAPDVGYRLVRGLVELPFDQVEPRLMELELDWLVDMAGRRLERDWLRPLGVTTGPMVLPEPLRQTARADVASWRERLLRDGPAGLVALNPSGEPPTRGLIRRLQAIHLAAWVEGGTRLEAQIALEVASQLGLVDEPWRALDSRLAERADTELAALGQARPDARVGSWLEEAFGALPPDPAPSVEPATTERLLRPRTRPRAGVHHLGLVLAALLTGLWLLCNRLWPDRRRVWFPLGAVCLPLLALVALECLLALAGAPAPAIRRPSLSLAGPDAPETVVERRVIDGVPHGVLVGGAARSGTFVAAPPPGSRRVFVVGGSSVFGANHLEEDAFPAVLERRLRALHPDRPLEVINAGMGGATSDQVLGFTADLVGYEPDLVVFYLGHNDLRPLASLLDRRLHDLPSLAAWVLVGRLRVTPLLERLLPGRLLDRAGRLDPDAAFLDEEPPSPASRVRALRLLELQATSNVATAARLCRRRGVDALVAVQGQPEVACGPDRDPRDDVCRQQALLRLALGAGRASGAPVVDTAGALRAYRRANEPGLDDQALYWDAIHPTRLGHALIGEALAPTVSRLLDQRVSSP